MRIPYGTSCHCSRMVVSPTIQPNNYSHVWAHGECAPRCGWCMTCGCLCRSADTPLSAACGWQVAGGWEAGSHTAMFAYAVDAAPSDFPPFWLTENSSCVLPGWRECTEVSVVCWAAHPDEYATGHVHRRHYESTDAQSASNALNPCPCCFTGMLYALQRSAQSSRMLTGGRTTIVLRVVYLGRSVSVMCELQRIGVDGRLARLVSDQGGYGLAVSVSKVLTEGHSRWRDLANCHNQVTLASSAALRRIPLYGPSTTAYKTLCFTILFLFPISG
jgi:hypothetical protein